MIHYPLAIALWSGILAQFGFIHPQLRSETAVSKPKTLRTGEALVDSILLLRGRGIFDYRVRADVEKHPKDSVVVRFTWASAEKPPSGSAFSGVDAWEVDWVGLRPNVRILREDNKSTTPDRKSRANNKTSTPTERSRTASDRDKAALAATKHWLGKAGHDLSLEFTVLAGPTGGAVILVDRPVIPDSARVIELDGDFKVISVHR